MTLCNQFNYISLGEPCYEDAYVMKTIVRNNYETTQELDELHADTWKDVISLYLLLYFY